MSNIGLIQSSKGEPLVSNIVLIQSPKREPLISNIIIILEETRLPHVYAGLSTVIVCAQKRAKYEPKLDVKDMYERNSKSLISRC